MFKKLRQITLNHQGLTKQHPFGRGNEATGNALDHLGYVQVDTISVVERAHHHTLWNRIPNYNLNDLNTLVRDRNAFEYWFHAASYLPMKDYRFCLPQMQSIKQGESRYYKNIDDRTLAFVHDKIKIDGPQKARDFKEKSSRKSTWWDWKPSKRALEKLFMQGDLMITERKGMEKVFDLTARVLPRDISLTEPTPMEFAQYLINTSIKANGFTTFKQLTHLRTGKTLRTNLTLCLQQMIESGNITEQKINEQLTVYAPVDLFDKKIKITPSVVKFLSPFDNAIIHRDRVEQLFDFSYRLECYVPAAKRQIGYFCLPILYGDELIGRVDCKAHRKTGILEIVHFHLEKQIKDMDKFIFHFVEQASNFAKFNQCQSITLTKVTPQKFKVVFKSALAKIN